MTSGTPRPELVLLQDAALERSIRRMACEIAEKGLIGQKSIFIGVEGSGWHLANRLAEEITTAFHETPEVYRWKRSGELEGNPVLNNAFVVLVDDVVFSGATTMRMMYSLPSLMLSSKTLIAALVDRGHRRYPVYADVVGLVAPTKLDEHIDVWYSPELKRVVLFK